jgi:hypothetical protein
MKDTSIRFRIKKILSDLDSSFPVDRIHGEIAKTGEQARKNLLSLIDKATAKLNALARKIDPIEQPLFVFDPTDPKIMAVIIGKEIGYLAPVKLDSFSPKEHDHPVQKFYGAGIYAIYYNGDFTAYRPICRTRCPIYVGSAIPKNPKAITPRQQGTKLFERIYQHAGSIRKATNLNLADFDCRYMVVQSGWEKAAEEYLIRYYLPVWNKESGVCSGKGKHGDLARKELSAWDVLHAGREWAKDQESKKGRTPETVTVDIEQHFIRLCEDDPGIWKPLLNQEWVKERFRR